MRARIGRYRVLGELGRGAMGVVYRGLDETLDREVALKVLSAAHASDKEARGRFLREGRAAGRLQHPNIVTIFELGEADGDPFMAMELLEGRDLQEAIHSGHGTESRAFLPVLLEVLAGLGHAHAHGIVHRDIKPSNIFLPRGLEAKITDFGIARLTANVGTAMTGTGVMVGTPHYMSPEQVKAAKVDARSDLFSTGLILFELVTGEKAYEGDSLVSILFKIVQGPPDLTRVPGSPPWARLRAVLARAVATDPDQRHPDAASMGHELRGALDDLREAGVLVVPGGRHATMAAPATLFAAPPPLSEPWTPAPEIELGVEAEVVAAAPQPRRSYAPLALGGFAALLALAAAGWLGWRAMGARPRAATASSALSVGPPRSSPSAYTGHAAPAAAPTTLAAPAPERVLPSIDAPPAEEAAAETRDVPPLAASIAPAATRPAVAPPHKVPALRITPREAAMPAADRIVRAEVLFEQGRFAGALREARAALLSEPGNAEARALVEDTEAALAVEAALKAARAAMARGDREAALVQVRNGLTVTATDSRLLALLRELQR